MTLHYETTGDIRGSCPHWHRTLSGALRCLERDQRGCASQGGYSDRQIVDSRGRVVDLDDDGSDWFAGQRCGEVQS